MDYKKKYLKYKNKYINIKHKFNLQQKKYGGNNFVIPIGINYESGKIITHILKCDNCVAYANCQIGMDAPYHGRVADETHRSKGRSELNFSEYREDLLVKNLSDIFLNINVKYNGVKLIIQIARGRAGKQMYDEVIKPILTSIGLINYEVVYGYRTKDYFNCNNFSDQFVFVNIGMFAVLTEPEKVYVGEVCNPIETWNINSYNSVEKEFVIDGEKFTFSQDLKNILNSMPNIKQIKLFGINDDMPFVTPDIYDKNAIIKLIKNSN